MLAIKMRRSSSQDEELRTIGVGTEIISKAHLLSNDEGGLPRVRHTQKPRMRMPQLKILIVKRVPAKDTCTPRAIPIYEIPSLNHKVGNHAVESAALVSAAALRLARAELAEVL